MNYIIVTGTSRGLGEAIAKRLLLKNTHIFCISRNGNEELEALAGKTGAQLDYFKFDLANVQEIEMLINDIYNKIDKSKAEFISLINNAGVVAPVKPIEKCRGAEIINNINVNLLAPVILSSAFIRNTKEFRTEKRIINISSGAGKNPYYGWGCYCSSKAGLDLFTQCTAVEQENADCPVKILSFAPGIVDTEMQAEIRSSKAEDFIQLDRFISFKKDGRLMSPDFVAEKVVELLFNKEFEQGGILDIRDMLTK